MPWATPTLREVRGLVRDSIRGNLPGADASIPNSVLRVMSDAQGGLCHLNLQYLDWLALQLLPDTAEKEWLDRHGSIWLVNSDQTTGRKMPSLAQGTLSFLGDGGTVVPAFTRLAYNDNVSYETLDNLVIDADAPSPVRARALDPGTVGNRLAGDEIGSGGINGVASVNVVVMDGGTDEETDDELRFRVLKRIREPPMGGAKSDYEKWALAVPGCTRAWCGPLEMGIGTVTVRVLFDDLRADNDGWPTQDDLNRVRAYLDSVRPVAVKDIWVLAPIKQFIDVYINNLDPDTPSMRAAIEDSIRAMLRELAAPGQTIYQAWISYAIMNTAGVHSFLLKDAAADHVMESPGHMAVLGSIFYDTPSQPAGEG